MIKLATEVAQKLMPATAHLPHRRLTPLQRKPLHRLPADHLTSNTPSEGGTGPKIHAARRNIVTGTEEILSRTGFFEKLSSSSIRTLSEICIPKHLVKREMLFFENDAGNNVFILVTGSIQVFKSDRDGKEVVIKILKPGEMFGEVVLFDKEKYPASAVALKDSFVYCLPKMRFLQLLRENHEFCTDFFATLMKKLNYLTNLVRYISNYDTEERLFLFLFEHYGKKPIITPTISKKDLASAISTTPETLSRILAKLKKEKRLIWDGKEIHFPELNNS